MFSEISDGVYVASPEGRILLANRAVAELLGHAGPEALLGHSAHDLAHHTRPNGTPHPAHDCPIHREVLGRGRTIQIASDWLVRRDGTFVPVSYSARPFPTGEGPGVVVVVRDMSGARRAEELRILESSTQVLVTAEDLDTGLEAVLRTLCEALGWRCGQIWVPSSTGELRLDPAWYGTGREADLFRLRSEGITGPRVVVAALDSGRPTVATDQTDDCRLAGLGGEVAVAVPVRAGHQLVALLEFMGSREGEEDRVAYAAAAAGQLGSYFLRKRAEDRLASHAAELARSNVDLVEFAEEVAHDLRHPLMSIARELELARESASRDAIDRAIRTARELERSVDALLQHAVARTRSALPLKPEDVVVQLVDDLRYEIDAAGADVVIRELPRVRADPHLLRLVLQNLILNALRHRGDRSPRIEIGSERPVADHVDLFVRDNGPGIDPRMSELIFEPHRRFGDSEGGSGIGLALARKIVWSLGGRLWVEPGEERGAIFWLRLPGA